MKIKTFCDVFKKRYKLPEIKNLDDILIYFKKLKESINRGDVSALIIVDYLYNNISSKRVRKRKSSATEFEDFLDYAFGGKVTDNETRKNISPNLLIDISQAIHNYISSNRREKMDILFPSGYGLSLKTSVPDNTEINLGSFAREALFEGFLTPQEYGGERKGGLGSKPQIELTLNKIKAKGQWSNFYKRFAIMVENIYVDDIIFVIKDDYKLQIYGISGATLRKIIIEAVEEGPKSAITVINRYEGNSIRVERDKIIQKGAKVEIDFSKIEHSNLKKIILHLEELEEGALIYLDKNDIRGCEKFLLNKTKEIINSMK